MSDTTLGPVPVQQAGRIPVRLNHRHEVDGEAISCSACEILHYRTETARLVARLAEVERETIERCARLAEKGCGLTDCGCARAEVARAIRALPLTTGEVE